MKALYLKKGEDKRLRVGHLWLFSNEVDTNRSPLKEFQPGECVTVMSSKDMPVGSAYVNPASLISARIYSNEAETPLNTDLLRERLGRAMELRDAMFGVPYYRLAFAEGDFLPGLVVDRYNDILVVQISTAGMEAVKDDVVSVLKDLCKPAGILLRNDMSSRDLEGLPCYTETAYGTVPAEIELIENGVQFTAPLTEGQKTGWFYDQRTNRSDFARFCKGKTVLDAFCYAGSFGCNAVKAGASAVTFLDASQTALDYATRNATRNMPEDDCDIDTVLGDALDTLQALKDSGRRFDVICIDPPAFIKRKKAYHDGLAAYQRVNRLAMELVEDGGIVMSCSCSQHLPAEDLNRALLHAANKTGARIQTLIQGHQGPDHPVHPAMPETHYLKSFCVRVLKGR